MLIYALYRRHRRHRAEQRASQIFQEALLATETTEQQHQQQQQQQSLIPDQIPSEEPEYFERVFRAERTGLTIQNIQIGRNTNRIVVSGVRYVSEAYQSGVKIDDVIVSIDGLEANDFTRVYRVLNSPDRPIRIRFLREPSSSSSSRVAQGSSNSRGGNQLAMKRLAQLEQENRQLHLQIQLLEGVDGEIANLSTIEECTQLTAILENTLNKTEKRQQEIFKRNVQRHAREDILLCVICRVNEKNAVLSPCSHVCVCMDCLTTHSMRLCPVCRKRVEQFHTVFL